MASGDAVLVLGGPGSGKTTALRDRLVALLQSGEDPERTLLLCASRRAARLLRRSVAEQLARPLPALRITTLHGLAFDVAGRRFEAMGFSEPPNVLTAAEQVAFVRDLLAGEDPARWPAYGGLLGTRAFARDLAELVIRAQERLLAPDALDGTSSEVARFYREYLDAGALAGRLDFAGLLAQTAGVLQTDTSERVDHLLVDDYQEMTVAGETIVRALSAGAHTVAIAADPAGGVFGYRGMTSEPLRRVHEAIRPLDTVNLGERWRAAPSAAIVFGHPGEEAEGVAREVLRARVDGGVAWDAIAVVVRRYGPSLVALRHAMKRLGVPHVVVDESAALAGEPAVRPIIDLLRYAIRGRTDLLEPLLLSPIGGLDQHGVRRARREARRRGVPLGELAGLDDTPADVANALDQIRTFADLARERAAVDRPDDVFFALWRGLPYVRAIVARDDTRELDALSGLAHTLTLFADRRPGAPIEEWLDAIDAADFGADPLVLPEERALGAVRIMSAHHAHGLELDVVIVAECVEGEFPSLRAREPIVSLDRLVDPARTPQDRLRDRVAEEGRLFDVAASRARTATILTASEGATARNPRTPSRYAERYGLTWTEPERRYHAQATTLRVLEAGLRRTLADVSAAPAQRLAAAAAIGRTNASPERWWGSRDWTDPGAPLFGEALTTSYSRLSNIDNCGLQYLYQVEMGLDPEQTHHMWLGSLVHGIIDDAHHHKIERTPEALQAAVAERWDSNVFPNRAIDHRRLNDAKDMLLLWLRAEESEPLLSEVGFRFELGADTIRGQIDAVLPWANGRTQVVDYKTSRAAIGEKDAPDDLQLAAYYLAMRRSPDLDGLGEPGRLELVYLGKTSFGKPTRRGFKPSDVADYESNAEERIRSLLDDVRAERFAPSPEADCQWCKFRILCPMWPEGDEVLAVTGEEAAP